MILWLLKFVHWTELRKLEKIKVTDKCEVYQFWNISLTKNLLFVAQKVEAVEKEDNAGGTVVSKTVKGRKTGKKFALEATRPSPMGQRVEPKIDAALRQKAMAAAAAKKPKVCHFRHVFFDTSKLQYVFHAWRFLQ